MIKKLRNQPYAPKVGGSSQMGAKRKKEEDVILAMKCKMKLSLCLIN
jgi:hypothetical protein